MVRKGRPPREVIRGETDYSVSMTSASAPWDAAAWEALKRCLPGARLPVPTHGLTRDEVHSLLTEIEAVVARDVHAAFAWDDERNSGASAASASGAAARLVAGGRSYRAGRFTTRAIGDLESSVRQIHTGRRETGAGRISFSALIGEHMLTDIGMLQAIAGPGTLFQIASQFNCLEAPGPSIVPVANYVHDNTQGPRASVSAFPGTFLRHYAAPAPDGTRFTQRGAAQLSLLGDVIPPHVAAVHGGYLTSAMVRDAAAFVRALETGFAKTRVGVHDDVEVVFGGNWGGPVAADAPPIAQVFTSTMALGMYSGGDGAGAAFMDACEWLLRAAYLGTLLAALELRKRTVILTLIGGGVFGNDLRTIWNAITWSVERVAGYAPADLDIILNARSIGTRVSRDEIAGFAQTWRGAVIQL